MRERAGHIWRAATYLHQAPLAHSHLPHAHARLSPPPGSRSLRLCTIRPAQSTGFLPYLGYNLEYENILIGVGYRAALPLDAPVVLAAQPTIEYQFQNDVTILQVDANVLAQFSGSSAIAPYAGAGLGILIFDTEFTDADSDLGLNLVGGAVFNPTGFGQPFAQARYSTAGADALTISGGVLLAF